MFKALRRIASEAALRVLSHYDAAVRWSRERGYIKGAVQDSRLDLNKWARSEIVRKCRHFERNCSIPNRMADMYEQYTIGANGIVMAFASTDEDWNKAASVVWDEWQPHADIASRQSFARIQSLCAYRVFFDGEIFLRKTWEKTKNGMHPRIQVIECQRVATPPDRTEDEGKTIHDGIEVDQSGRPLAYWVRDSFIEEKWQRFLATDIIHVFEPSRPGQLRGLPLLTPVVNTLCDLEELKLLTMRIAKKFASIAAIFKRRNSELPQSQIRAARLSTTTTTNTGDAATETRIKNISETYGGDMIALYPDEDIEQPKGDLPSAAQREHWDYLTAEACIGCGIPKILVFPHSMQGTVTRADLDVAATWFKSRFGTYSEAFKRVAVWVIDWYKFQDIRVSDPPADGSWRNIDARAPRAVNVDVGRNSSAVLAEIEGGIRTFQSVIGEQGEDWRSYLEQKAIESKHLKALAEKYAVSSLSISKYAIAGTVSSGGDVQAQALNGAQLASIQTIIQAVSLGQLPAESAKIILYLAVPTADRADIDKMVDSAAAFVPRATPSEPTPMASVGAPDDAEDANNADDAEEELQPQQN